MSKQSFFILVLASLFLFLLLLEIHLGQRGKDFRHIAEVARLGNADGLAASV